MTTAALKKKIHQCVDSIDDTKILEAFYTLLNSHLTDDDSVISDEQLKLIESRKKAYKAGKEKAYTVNEVKAKLLKNLRK